MNLRIQESLIKATLTNAKEVFIFADTRMGVITASSRLENASVHSANTFVVAHEADNRNSPIVHVNVHHVISYVNVSAKVPVEIVNLYTAPEGETSEQKAERELEVKNYFDQI